MDTEYTLVASPPKPLVPNYEDKHINWNNWLNSEDPLAEDTI